MPLPQKNWDAEVVNALITEQLAYDREAEAERACQKIALLNDEQRRAFEKIIDSVQHRHGKTYFVNGPGGTGKTFVYTTVCHHLRSKDNIVLCVCHS
ncbi:PIF1-like helicase-domain-containing protein, partial [Mycena haematopus]